MTRNKIGSRGSFSGQVFESITAAETLSNNDSGRTFMIDSSGGSFSITLPTTLKPGVKYKFVVDETNPTNDITIAFGSAIAYGNLCIQADTNEDNRVACAGKSNILFDTNALRGDFLEVECDGTYWNVLGMGGAQGAFTTS